MIFRTDTPISKQIIYVQIAALVMMLVYYPLGILLFVMSSIMSLKQMNQAQNIPDQSQECIMSKEAIASVIESEEQCVEKERVTRQKALDRETKKAENDKWQTVVEATILVGYKKMSITDIPNGFVIRGPADKPVLVDFDEQGKLVSKGLEVEMGDWLKGFGDTVPDDVVVLVHAVKGESQILIKSLEVNRIMKGGESIAVKEAARLNLLPQVVEALRETYMENMQKKEVEEILEETNGNTG